MNGLKANMLIESNTFSAFIVPKYLSQEEADILMETCVNLPNWVHHKIKVFGKECYQPRLTMSMHDDNVEEYAYSNAKHPTTPWNLTIKNISDRLNRDLTTSAEELDYNSCLLNYYRNGLDYIGEHSDKTTNFKSTTISGISLGATRKIVLKQKITKEKVQANLTHGDLFVMKGDFQEYYTHGLPKQTRVYEPRISLTFRSFK